MSDSIEDRKRFNKVCAQFMNTPDGAFFFGYLSMKYVRTPYMLGNSAEDAIFRSGHMDLVLSLYRAVENGKKGE